MILAAGGYDYNVSVVFSGKGISSLRPAQDATAIGATDLLKTWKALPVYEVTQLYALQENLTAQDINLDTLVLPVTAISQTQLHTLLRQHDIVLRY